MCGIAGFFQPGSHEVRDVLERRAVAMARAIAHRGPDLQAGWADPRHGIALGHARLSILDLTAMANQPMHSPDRRYTIVFNGEIYNYRTLAAELRSAGYAFRSTGDTEIIPAAVDAWGIERAVQRLDGIFAFALWDAERQVLHLVRDHIGVKPLYYGLHDGVLMFGSTLKALFAHPRFHGDIDAGALAEYLRYCYVPEPSSIFTGVSKLSPGTIVTFDASLRPASIRYWDVALHARAGTRDPFQGSEEEISRAFEKLALDAVRGQLVSDVPLGAFLSGGIDSSLVSALMQASAPGSVKTFTIGFEDARFDESAQARDVARHLGTQHTEMFCTTREALDLIPEIPHFFDEPFADSSQIPTLLLSRLTRSHVTVALSGDGGDELFAGYDRYFWMFRLRQLRDRVPAFAARWMSSLAERVPRERSYPVIHRLFRTPQRWTARADRFYHLARMLRHYDDFAYLYRTTPMSVATLRDGRVLGDEHEPSGAFDDVQLRRDFPDLRGLDADRRPEDLHGRGYPPQGGSFEHGVWARSARAAPRSAPGRVFLARAADDEAQPNSRQATDALDPLSLSTAGARRSTQAGLFHSARRLAERRLARVGRKLADAAFAGARQSARCCGCAPVLDEFPHRAGRTTRKRRCGHF